MSDVFVSHSRRDSGPTTGRVLRDERIAGQLSGVAHSPGEAILAVGTDRGVALLDPATGAEPADPRR
jgi:hypothetical protein